MAWKMDEGHGPNHNSFALYDHVVCAHNPVESSRRGGWLGGDLTSGVPSTQNTVLKYHRTCPEKRRSSAYRMGVPAAARRFT